MKCKALIIGILLVLSVHIAFAQTAVSSPPWLVAIEAKESGDRPVMGSGILLDRSGLVATDWHLVAGIDRVRVAVVGAGVFEATHAHAVCQGKNVVLIKLENFASDVQLPKLVTELPQVEDELTLLFMASGQRPVASQIVGKVSRVLSGEMAVESQSVVKNSAPGFARDATWIRIEAIFGSLQRGGAILSGDNLAGIIVTAPNERDSLTNALYAQHLTELLSNPLPAPLALARMQKIPDLPLADLPASKLSGLSDTLWDRGLPLPERLQKFAARRALVASGVQVADKRLSEARKQIATRNSQMTKLKNRGKQIEDTLAKIKPIGVVPSYSRRLSPAETRNNRGGRNEDRTTLTVPGWVEWDPEVVAAARPMVAEYQALAADWTRLDREVQGFELEQAVTDFEHDLCANVLKRSPQLLFQIADAAGHRPRSEHEAALEKWTELLSDATIAPAALVARSWSHMHLGRLDEAEQDLRAAYKSATVKEVCAASIARLLYRQQKNEQADAQSSRALPLAKANPAALMILALTAWEQENHTLAAERLEDCCKLTGDVTEAHRLAALLYATGPDTIRSAERAQLHARWAVQMTHAQDELCLLALAAAEAEAGSFPASLKHLDQAAALSVGDLTVQCDNWKVLVSKGKPIRTP